MAPTDRAENPETSFSHESVMITEVVEFISGAPAGVYVDATLGGAGHASATLAARDDMTLLGLDRDPAALASAEQRLAPFGDRVVLRRARFDQLGSVLSETGLAPIAAILFDLGVSSPQLDHAHRGFSFRSEGPVDMRMDPEQTLTAADIVNTWDQNQLAQLLRTGGDERFAGRIAAAIVGSRPILDTVELAEIVRAAIPAATRRTGGHPAKRTFQALRIAVNDELDQLQPALNQAIDALMPDGRGTVLSYHSGEDRIVKSTIADAELGGCVCPPRLPCVCGAAAKVTIPAPRTRTPSDDESAANPRARSARMRCFIRTDADQGSAR